MFVENNFRGGEMLFEIENPRRQPRLLYFKHFDAEVILQQTREQVLYFFSTMATNRADRFPLQKKTVEKAVPCCTLVILETQTNGFHFEKE